MPRPLRNIAQGCTHHVYSRCHGKKNHLLGKYGKKYFIESIKKCQEKYDFKLIAAEIVANHIHLIIITTIGEQTISYIMQYIKARIAEKYNKATGETGAFWNERFGSSVIEDAENPQEYLLWLLWYIGYNPVRKGLSRNPRMNDIGFINCYLDRNHLLPIKITLHHFFYLLGNTFEDCVKRFLFYEEAYLKRLAVYFW
jgi:REP element-mobilizing transposase RayT